MMSAVDILRATKARADQTQADRDNYAAYVADRRENGGWTDEDVAEYRAEVVRIMQSGTDDERLAAREFWAHKAREMRMRGGISARIRESIAVEKMRKAA